MSKNETELARAQAALDRGSPKGALRHAWAAGIAAARADDQERLEAVLNVAAVARERTTGSLQLDAENLCIYCSRALADAKAGLRRGSLLSGIFAFGQGRTGKICPACAERVKGAARVCRFCGYRFHEP